MSSDHPILVATYFALGALVLAGRIVKGASYVAAWHARSKRIR